MTDGPYNESIRGPGNAGLGGIFSQLAAIVAGLGSLPQMAADVAALRTVVERLVGTAANTPAGWLGLPWAFGIRDEVGDETLMQLLLNMGLNANAIASNTSSTASFTNTIRQAILRIEGTPQANLRQLVTALELVRDDMDALSLVTGRATDPPIGSTIKALLASIDVNQARAADCCEEGGGTGNTYPPPTTGCGVTPTTWHEATLELKFSEVEGNDVYMLVPPATILSVETFVNTTVYSGGEPDFGLVAQLTTTGQALSLDACIAWNFDASSQLVNMAVGVPITGGATPFTSYTSFSEVPPQEGSVLQSWQARTDAGVKRGLQANFGFANGVAPIGKVYIGLPTPE